MDAEWIGVEHVAAEMGYTQRQAWEFIRSIGLVTVNTRKMGLARFTRAEFEDARERAKAPMPRRVRTGVAAGVAPTPDPGPAAAARGRAAAGYAAKREKLKGA